MSNSKPFALSFVADRYRHYPGETATLAARLETSAPLPTFTLRLEVPATAAFDAYHLHGLPELPPAEIELSPAALDPTRALIWRFTQPVPAGTRLDAEVQVQLPHPPGGAEAVFAAQAEVDALTVEGWPARTTAEVDIRLAAQGSYLRYLPALYQQDELMGRFLMLFESFWAPLENHIDNFPYYVDPQMTPAHLLPWLAAWVDLTLDENWPEARRRQLLRAIMPLYRQRGTRRGLHAMLEIYTGQAPEIREERARNFRLGPGTEARLGSGIALGTANLPHTFAVNLRLPPVTVPATARDPEAERARLELQRRRKIQTLIDAEKPAHTTYTLNIESR